MNLSAATMRRLVGLDLPPDKFDALLSILEGATTAKSAKKAESEKRATRLAADWVLPSKWGQYALDQGLRESEVRTEAQNFKDYWLGCGKTKVDWEATWRTWARRTATRLNRTAKPTADQPALLSGPAGYDGGTWATIMRIYARTNNWKIEHGPPPHASGYLGPPINGNGDPK